MSEMKYGATLTNVRFNKKTIKFSISLNMLKIG